MMKRIPWTAVVLAIFVGVAFAQDPPPPRGKAQERVEQWKKIRLVEVLKLDEEGSIRFLAKYNKHMENLRAIGKDRMGIIDGLDALKQEKAKDTEIIAALDELGKVEERIAQERNRFLLELRSILSVRQIAAYVVFEKDFNQNLREIMQEIARNRMEKRLER